MEDSIRLWIAVAPPQLEELRTLQRISPDILYLQDRFECDSNVLEKVQKGEFRWYGLLLPEEYDGQGRLLYRIIDQMVVYEPVRERPDRN